MRLEGYPKDVTLRDGASVSIRPIEPDDGEALAGFYRELPEEDRLFLREDVTRPEWSDEFIRSVDFDRVFSLLAEHQERVVGNATLYRSRHGWSAHVAEIRIAVARPFQHHGLGTALASQLVRHATSLGLEKIVAHVVDNQVGAKRAFEKLGFHKDAVLRGHVKDIRGVTRDLVVMSNDVSHLWEAMAALMADYSPTMGE
jgi:RimJ/RimL family protein N-acetyltransferase